MKQTSICLPLLLLLHACSPGGDAKDGAKDHANTRTSSDTAGPAPVVVARENTERLFQNPYDTEAVYFLSQKNGTPDALTVLIKRDSKDGVQYSRWRFNCVDKSAQNLGVAANIQDLDKPEDSMASKSQHYEEKT